MSYPRFKDPTEDKPVDRKYQACITINSRGEIEVDEDATDKEVKQAIKFQLEDMYKSDLIEIEEIELL